MIVNLEPAGQDWNNFNVSARAKRLRESISKYMAVRHMVQGGMPQRGAAFALRGMALWLIIPFGTLAWVLVIVWMRGIPLGAFLGWLDWNFTCALQDLFSLNRFGVQILDRWPWRDVRALKHRISWLDMW